MPTTCVVKNCKNNTKTEKISTFKVPSDERERDKWQIQIKIPKLFSFHRVCEKHFEKSCIIKKYVKYDNNGKKIVEVPLKHARLKEGSLPTIFDGNVVKSRKSHKESVLSEHAYSLPFSRDHKNLANLRNTDNSVHKDVPTDSENSLIELNIKTCVITNADCEMNENTADITMDPDNSKIQLNVQTCSITNADYEIKENTACSRGIDCKSIVAASETIFTDCEMETDTDSTVFNDHEDISENTTLPSSYTVKLTYDDDNIISFRFTKDSFAIYYYVRLRMRQYIFQENQKVQKQSAIKRKMSKLEKN